MQVILCIVLFFGHRDYSYDSEYSLEEEIEKLILGSDVDVFYVGNKGTFDRAVHRVLKSLKNKYLYIKVYIVLDTVAPIEDECGLNEYEREYFEELKEFEFLLPDGIENVPKRYAMSYRNRWMINACDIAVVYCRYPGTNTQKHVDALVKAGKTVINLANLRCIFLM